MIRVYAATAVLTALAAILLAVTADAKAADTETKPDKLWVFVGTYTGKESKGIYRFELDLATGKLTDKRLAAETSQPVLPGRRIPATSFSMPSAKVGQFDGKKGGAVSAFAIDPKTGALTLLNQQTSGGAGPCHLVVDKKGKNVLAANYGGGSVDRAADRRGRQSRRTASFHPAQGQGGRSEAAGAPHAHSINLDAANRFAFAADLGLDKVLVYKFDADKGTLTPNDPPFVPPPRRPGPRHFAFHPERQVRLRHQRDRPDRDAVRLRRRQGRAEAAQDRSRRCRRTSTARITRRPKCRCIRRASSCTAPTAATNSIAIFCHRPEDRQTDAGRPPGRRTSRRRATSASIRRERISSSPTRTATV